MVARRSKLAFNSFRDPSGIYVMDADGSDEALLNGEDVLGDPAWSPRF